MDPTLAALFQQSAGPVQKPPKKVRTLPSETEEPPKRKSQPPAEPQEAEESQDVRKVSKERKKKRKRDDILLEDLYMSKLVDKPLVKDAKKSKTEANSQVEHKAGIKPLGEFDDTEDKIVKASTSPAPDDASASDSDESGGEEEAAPTHVEEPDKTPAMHLVHETTLRQDKELEKAKATIFVGNLPTSVITSHTDYKHLKELFSKYGRVKSVRFRSIAFSELLPRKVAFVQRKFHPERDTFNAYVVMEDPLQARKSLELNGHYFLGIKHIRVDSVAHPAAHNNKKCVFVGSLPFDAEEELLWTHFSPAGTIESVRLIRDKKTNVGKGFAYVQFADSSSVQSALLLNDKKMLLGEGKGARKLRVTRAQTMPSLHKSTQKERDQIANPGLKPRDKAKLGRVKNMMGSQAAAKLKLLQKEIAMEGERAKAPEGQKKRQKKKSKKDTLRSKARAAAYRKTEAKDKE